MPTAAALRSLGLLNGLQGPGRSGRRGLLVAALFLGSAVLLSSAAPATEYSAQRLIAPYFAVEDDNPNGQTTLLAVRNEKETDLDLNVFASGGGTVSLNRNYVLKSMEVKTLNLRDVLQGLLDPDGFRRGSLIVEDDGRFGSPDTTPESLNGDFFNVNPGENFATGGNLGGNRYTESFGCSTVTTRFLVGGVFTGGTIVSAYVGNARGDDPDDPPTVLGTVYDEPGTELGTFELKMP